MKTHRSFVRPWMSLVVVVLISGGCVRSEHPLGSAKDAKPDARLIGQWHDKTKADQSDAQDIRVSFDAQGKGQLTTRGDDGTWGPAPKIDTFFVIRSKNVCYFNVLVRDDDKSKPAGTDPDRYYYCFKYEVSEDGQTLKYWSFKNDFMAKAVADGKLHGKVEPSAADPNTPDVTLHDSSEDLLHFIDSSAPEGLYADMVTLTRVK